MHYPVHTSHTLAVLSKEEVRSLSPSVLKFKLTISALCPARLNISYPVSTSQIFAVWSIDPVATSMPWGSNCKQTISILWPFKVWYLWPVLASQIFAVLSNEPVTILSLHDYWVINLPVGVVKSHCVNHILMFFQRKQLCAAHSVPNFTGSIVTSSDESI
jgi:hypothetical protein